MSAEDILSCKSLMAKMYWAHWRFFCICTI